jgi:integrase
MSKSTRSRRRRKPAKPYPDFPLFPHNNGSWAKKIKGRLCYFGSWADPQAALALYLETKDELFAGKKPRTRGMAGVTMADLANQFLNSKRHLLEAGELVQRTWDDYYQVTDRLIEAFGRERLVEDLQPDDFRDLRYQLSKKWGVVTLKNFIIRARVVFKFAYDNGLVPSPVRYGQEFKRPSLRAIREARHAKGIQMFEAAEIRRMLEAAGQPLRAMILLGINCGFGNADCGHLPENAVDLERGWVNFPRPKTAIIRRCPLWPETIEAIKDWLKRRPRALVAAAVGRVFVTRIGNEWGRLGVNSLSAEMAKLLRKLGINGKRNFYALRHTFETVAGESRDQIAVDAIMGHVRQDMASIYRERISDQRLKAVTDHVRQWLFGPAGAATGAIDIPTIE